MFPKPGSIALLHDAATSLGRVWGYPESPCLEMDERRWRERTQPGVGLPQRRHCHPTRETPHGQTSFCQSTPTAHDLLCVWRTLHRYFGLLEPFWVWDFCPCLVERSDLVDIQCFVLSSLISLSGVFVKIHGQPVHPDCFRCKVCKMNLAQKGYFWINETMFCETHAKQAAQPPAPGMVPVALNWNWLYCWRHSLSQRCIETTVLCCRAI